jgi:hypothetical protein
MPDSPATTDPSPPWPDRARAVLLALAGLALTVYFHTPLREVLTPTLDGSNYASYAHFTARGFQYGPEVVSMAGPYGFVLYGWVYSGELFWVRTISELILNASLAALTLWFLRHHRGSWWRWGWLAAHVAFTPFIEDLPVEWALLLAGLYLLQTTPRPGVARWVLPVSALLAFLSLIKGTQLVLGLATLLVVLAGHTWLRRWRHVALLAGGYVGALLLFWSLAGQNPLHLLAYGRGMLELAGGYNEAMSLDEPARVFLRGVLVSVGLAAGLGWALWHHRHAAITVASLLLLAGHSYGQWKHGFVRADGHAYIYFHYAIVAALAASLVAGRRPVAPIGRFATSALIALLLAILGTACYGGESLLPDLRGTPRRVWTRFEANCRYLRDLSEIRADFATRLAAQRRLHALPLVRRTVGQHPIDLFGFEHARLTLNGLNYRPRPMGGGSFNVYTPALMQLNRDYLRDPARRPDYYLVRVETIDERFLPQDDGLALLDLLHLYHPVLMEQNHLLMRAIPGAGPPEPRLVDRRTFQIGETIPVPASRDDELLLARFDLRPSLLGRLRSVFYKLPQIRISLRGPGVPVPDNHRLIPAMAASPFLLAPMVEDMRDFLELYTPQSQKLPRELRISTRDRTWFNKTVSVEFYAVPRPTPPAGVDVAELLRFTASGVETVDTVDAASGQPRTVRGLLVHPPTRLAWVLQGMERSLTFGFGLVPGAYAGGDRTDGVEFTATLLRPGEPPQRIFQRLLDPTHQPADRGHQTAAVALPAHLPTGSRIEIATGPGPHGSEAFDWAYLSELDLVPAEEVTVPR